MEWRALCEGLSRLALKVRAVAWACGQRVTWVLGGRAIIPCDVREQWVEIADTGRDKGLRSRSGRRYRLGQAKGGQSFTAVSVVNHLVNEVAGRFEDRAGGYTRVIRLSTTNKGDNAATAILQLVGDEQAPGTVTRPEKTARKRRTERRYAFAATALKAAGGVATQAAPAKEEAPVSEEAPAVEDAKPEVTGEEESKD